LWIAFLENIPQIKIHPPSHLFVEAREVLRFVVEPSLAQEPHLASRLVRA